jgi:tRNA(adenine34) deaminase
MILDRTDEYFMKEALKEAIKAMEKNEIPVGAVIVSDGDIIARGHNLTETLNDVTAHAEMQAITAAANNLGGKYLHNCTMYVTLEPCIMCAGAALWSQIGEIKYGAKDEKRGFTIIRENLLHPKTKLKSGVLEKDCSELLKTFFRRKRNNY